MEYGDLTRPERREAKRAAHRRLITQWAAGALVVAACSATVLTGGGTESKQSQDSPLTKIRGPLTPVPPLELSTNPPVPYIDYVNWNYLKKQGWTFVENVELGRHYEHYQDLADELQRLHGIYGYSNVLTGVAGAKFDVKTDELESQTEIMSDTASNPNAPVYQAVFVRMSQA